MTDLLLYGAKEEYCDIASERKLSLARVVCQRRLRYTLMTAEGEIDCTVSGKFSYAAHRPVDYPVVGDWVLYSAHGIETLVERKTLLTRAAAGKDRYPQPIAANMDFCFICIPANAFNPRKLERYLAVTECSGAKSVVVLTKADLVSNIEQICTTARAFAPTAEIIACSNKFDEGYDAAHRYMKVGITAVLIGPSGVGKSTLINALAGSKIKTNEVRSDGKGRHTTTVRELILLDSGGILIDNPGMRELGLEDSDVNAAFPDIDKLSVNCFFDDCTHMHEPRCAVRAAVARGEISQERYDSYVKLKREENARDRRRITDLWRKK